MLVNIIQNTISSFRSALAAAEVITTNLKMWLGFETSSIDGDSQITPDKSGNNNVGELFTGKALDFDGAGDYVDIDFTTQIKSAVFWVKPLDTGVQSILGFGGVFAGSKYIKSVNNNIQSAGLSSVSVYVNGVSTTSVPVNQWSRVVVNFALLTPQELTFGYFDTYGYIELSDVQLYDENLSADDIAYDYANPNKLAIDNPSTSLSVTNLKGYWALSEGDGKLAYDSGTNLEEEEVQNGTFNLGSEIADNNTINNNGGGVITKLSDLNYNATSDGTSSSTIKPRILPTLTLNKTYKIVVTPRNQSGTIRFNIYDGAKYLLPWVDGFTEPIVVYLTKSGNTPFFSFNGQNTFNLDFTLSVKEIPNWELDSDWSVANNTAIYVGDGNANELLQEISFIGGRRYEIKIDVASISGSLKARFNNDQANKAVFNQTGIQTLYITATGSGNITNDLSISRESQVAFNAVLNSVSVREVTASDHGGLINGADYVDAQPRIPQLGMQNWSKGSNLFPYSEDFTEWVIAPTTSQVLLAASEAAPYGQGDVYSITMQASESDAYIRYATTNATLTSSTHSVWVKQAPTGSATHIRITNNNRAAWNTGTSEKIALTSSWQRLETTDAITGNRFTIIGSADASGTQDSDCLGKALIYGAQLLEGSSAGVYRFTDGAATSNSIVIANPTIPTQDIFGNAVRDRLNSFNLDGSGYATNETLPTISGNISLSFWVKLDTFVSGNLGQILGKREGSSWLRVYRPYASHLRLEVAAGQQYTFSVTENQWVYVAITINSSNQVSVYVDDSAASGATLNTSFSFINTEVFTVGAWLNPALQPTSKLNGLVSDVLIYDRVLTSDEVENNYNAGLSAHTN